MKIRYKYRYIYIGVCFILFHLSKLINNLTELYIEPIRFNFALLMASFILLSFKLLVFDSEYDLTRSSNYVPR